jgi:carbamoyltransferase
MTAILGISAYYHDSAAALLVDGRIVAAAQEERFTRKKADERFPEQAIAYCLQAGGLTAAALDYVGFYEKPLLKFDRLLETYLSFAPAGYRSFSKAMPQWLRTKLHLPREIRRGLGGAYKRRIVFCEHHESHAASAFYPSPFESAAIVTLDGVGEWTTTSIGIGEGANIRLLSELRFPHSLGLLYSAFTYFCGFRVNSGEYKLMGLAPYGKPLYVDAILQHLMQLREDGSFWLNQSYFNYCQGLTMTGPRFHKLFGAEPRRPEEPIRQLDMDLASSVQQVTEQVMLRIARHAHRVTGQNRLCLAGGVALNCVGNGRILREGPFEQLWIQPAAGDAGGALGVAQWIWHQLLQQPRTVDPLAQQRGSLWGPRYSSEQIRSVLDQQSARYEQFSDEFELLTRTSALLAAGQVVGWVQDRMEFGPRALGARSILGDPRRVDMQSMMNLKIKFRESFRPFAPAVVADSAPEFFELPAGTESPYMLLTCGVQAAQRRAPTATEPAGLEKVHEVRSTIPAVTHVDYSARVQTVDEPRNGRFARLLKRFADQTGCPVLINTSFNVRGEPIVCTPADAYRCFMATDMDALVIEDFLLLKSKQPQTDQANARREHLRQFALD